MRILVVGSGRLVYFLARSLLEKGFETTIVDPDRTECTWLARRLRALVLHGDGGDARILEEARASGCDVAVVTTGHDHDNLAISQLLSGRFGVDRTLAIVNDPDNEEVFRKLGIRDAISPTRVVTNLIEERAFFSDVLSLMPLAEGRVQVAEVRLTEGSPAAGATLRELRLPEESLVAVVLRGDGFAIPDGRMVLHEGDRLIVVSSTASQGSALRALTGEERP